MGEITENNKLIAKFMGWTFHPEERDTGLEFVANTWSPPNSKDIYVEREFLFHRSWDWLMPVIADITSIDEDTLPDRSEYDERLQQIQDALISVDIKETFDQVVDFIKWYNERVKSENE